MDRALTATDQQVILLLARALPNRLVADQLRVSESKAESLMADVLGKLGLPDRAHLEASPEPARPGARRNKPDALTPRERQVAMLVARGLSNREIGTTLVISQGTAAQHVKSILAKLGFGSRARIAAWAADQARLDAEWARDQMDTRVVQVVNIPMARTASELSDEQWAQIEPLLPPRASTGRIRADDRRTVNGILWVLRTGARWADVPRQYGAASTCHLRFQQWQRSGVWDRLWAGSAG